MVTITEACQFYASWAECQVSNGQMAPRTRDYYFYYHRDFQKNFGKKWMDELIPLDLMLWGSSWHKVQAVKRLYSWARLAGLIASNPMADVPKPAYGERSRVLERREQVLALRATYRAFRTFLIGLRESMARPQEVRWLRWSELRQLKAGELYAVQSEFKGRKRRKDKHSVRVIPFSPRLARLIRRLAGRPHDPTVTFFSTPGVGRGRRTRFDVPCTTLPGRSALPGLVMPKASVATPGDTRP